MAIYLCWKDGRRYIKKLFSSNLLFPRCLLLCSVLKIPSVSIALLWILSLISPHLYEYLSKKTIYNIWFPLFLDFLIFHQFLKYSELGNQKLINLSSIQYVLHLCLNWWNHGEQNFKYSQLYMEKYIRHQIYSNYLLQQNTIFKIPAVTSKIPKYQLLLGNFHDSLDIFP